MQNIDYAIHAIHTKQHIKALQDSILVRDYEKALEEGTKALVELRMAIVAIQDMREKDWSRR